MKIGIMTFWSSEDNYGQLLQCYALQKYLRDAGHDAFLIRYDPRNDCKSPLWKKILKAFNPVKLYQYFLDKKIEIFDRKEKQNNPRYFEDFRNKHIRQSEKIYYFWCELEENPPDADVYITGSDQIWNPDFLLIKRTNMPTRAYFLDFGKPQTRRIAYAASFGMEKIEDNYIREIVPLLQKFQYISVREKTGLQIMSHQCGINTAEWVCDPTMLIDENRYRNLYTNESIRKPKKPYCLLYIVGNGVRFPIQKVYDWAKNKNLEMVYVGANLRYDNYKKYCATIYEWLYLIDNAEYVITSSFHGSVFSVLFQKQFGIIPLPDKGINDRLVSLLALCGIENRDITDSFAILDMNIDWQSVAAELWRIRSSHNLLDSIYN